MFVFVFVCDVYVHVCCGVETTCRLPRWLGLFHKRAPYTKGNKEPIKNRALLKNEHSLCRKATERACNSMSIP